MNLLIELDSVPKYRNATEWRNIGRASCPEFGIVKTGDGAYIGDICRAALDLGCDPSRKVEVRRKGTLCFKLASVDAWAHPPDTRPEHLK
jgi:hypothetical protein